MAEYIQSKTLTECNWFHFKYKSNEKIIENMMKNLQMDPE